MLLPYFLVMTVVCYGQDHYSIRDLKNGKFKADSSYVYALPFENKKRVFLVQAYESKMSHRGERALGSAQHGRASSPLCERTPTKAD